MATLRRVHGTVSPRRCLLCHSPAAALMHSETTHSRAGGLASWLGRPNLLDGVGDKLHVKP